MYKGITEFWYFPHPPLAVGVRVGYVRRHEVFVRHKLNTSGGREHSRCKAFSVSLDRLFEIGGVGGHLSHC